ncbi:unnamed protein product [Brassica oleracea var. botrytis]
MSKLSTLDTRDPTMCNHKYKVDVHPRSGSSPGAKEKDYVSSSRSRKTGQRGSFQPNPNTKSAKERRQDIENLPDGLQKLKKLMHLYLERTCRLRSVVGISRLPLLSVLRLRSSKCLADLDTVNELKRMEHLEAVTIDISSASALEELLLYNKLAKSIQRLSIVEAKNNLVLSATDDLIDLTIRSCSTLKVEIKRSSSRRSFLNLSTVCISSCDGLKELTWLLFAPNLTVLELRG